MDFFTPVTKPSQGTQETLEKVYVRWNKGLKLGTKSAEHRAKLSASQKGRPKSAEHRAMNSAGHCKPVMTPRGLFPSRLAVAKAYDTYPEKVGFWIQRFSDQFYYVKD